MKWIELKEILDNEFPPESADYEWDSIGEQVNIKEEISRVLVTLDITIDVISQAQEQGVDLIIAHHPLFFGDKNEILSKDPITNAKHQLLLASGIGVYIIHTNADFNPNSIAYMQGLALGLENLEQANDNRYVTGELKEKITSEEFMSIMKEVLELNEVEFRSNFDLEEEVKNVLIASGAGGDNINLNSDYINVIGEVKYHEWVKAKEAGARVIEISHFSEKIFKNIVSVFLEKQDVTVVMSEENNGYKIY